MPSDYFRFKQFEIEQRQSAMRVGTDGVLLGAWADVRGDEQRVLDVGCGTGLLALMVAQRNSKVVVDAIEIEPLAAQEAALNARRSRWNERIFVREISLQEYAATSEKRYCLIISNPPFFLNSSHNMQLTRTAARHAALLPYSDLVDGVISLLKPEGRFCAIFPYSEAGIFMAKAAREGLYCNKKLNITPIAGRSVKRIAAEFSFAKTELLEENLTIETTNPREYSREYRELTSPFYLRF
ncbi:tRNA (adenine37-N(6))-methyltransferase TrmN6 [Mucinivorans hirudinis]|uniref:tRNA1(Val) (adenine(37)-N6)-methyltransferase n=1 Tax=Mucinivorans hirudinis TaxID=1433126 RepID=A0A060RAJ0_9BACT|nr:tRNA (adenine37-N(6))-methyltransferase TrmN6 [Mucinivorans hirudinis]